MDVDLGACQFGAYVPSRWRQEGGLLCEHRAKVAHKVHAEAIGGPYSQLRVRKP